jgi:CIC family chloride channel protein
MTGNYELILPLFVACFASLLIADALNDLPIYEALLERDLNKS